jgi:hypothetical protein
MKRGGVWIVVGVGLALLVVWIARNTSWVETQVPMPLKGEALRNPFYAAQRFSEVLGARTSVDHVLAIPPSDAVIVLAAWHWSLTDGRRKAMEAWVESGGRLVVDQTLAGGQDEFEHWSGIVHHPREADELKKAIDARGGCREYREEGADVDIARGATYRMCEISIFATLSTQKAPEWALRDQKEIQALRVAVGRGSVTVINAVPFRYRNFLEEDHARIFVAATELRRGDEVHFLTEDDHPSLLALAWQYGAPVVILGLTIVALALWRGGIRFGPLAAPLQTARRSLAEQIRGTGQFALRHGGGEALHAAAVRALDEAAARRVSSYARLSAKERAAALGRLTGIEPASLAAAIYHPRLRRSSELRSTIALLENARRLTLNEHARSSHGTK